MEALIIAIIIAYAVKKAAGDAHNHWQGSKAANRKASKGKPVRQRAASAGRHDTAYWAEQVRGGFPQVRHGLYMGWNAGRVAQLEGWQARAQARAEHAHLRARVTEAVREQRRRQDEALERIRAAARQPEPAPEAALCEHAPVRCLSPMHCSCPCPDCDGQAAAQLQAAVRGRDDPLPPMPSPQPEGDSTPATTPTEGNTMSGDTTYTQQLSELETIRREAEAEAAATGRFRSRLGGRLDELQSLGLDRNTLSEAAEIDDALQAQEKAAQQTLDATDAAISGLKQRHGGIQEAVSDSPVDKPADPGFYQD